MPTRTPIAINDGAATPVTHTYVPQSADGHMTILREKVGVPLVWPMLTTSCRPPVANNGLYRVKFKLDIPTPQVDAQGKTTVAYTRTVNIEFILAELSTAQERKDLRVLAANLLQNASIISMIEGPEPMM